MSVGNANSRASGGKRIGQQGQANNGGVRAFEPRHLSIEIGGLRRKNGQTKEFVIAYDYEIRQIVRVLGVVTGRDRPLKHGEQVQTYSSDKCPVIISWDLFDSDGRTATVAYRTLSPANEKRLLDAFRRQEAAMILEQKQQICWREQIGRTQTARVTANMDGRDFSLIHDFSSLQ